MSYETLLTEAREGVGVVTVNRPDVRNAVNRRIIESVRSTLDRFRKDDGVGTVIFTGAG
jgi:enoyl-CoA hydratase/carnithine racemase